MHLSKEDRIMIETSLNHHLSFKQIATLLHKHPSSVSREVKNHLLFKNIGALGRPFNPCSRRSSCPDRYKNCRLRSCLDFIEERCPLLDLPPYVCNGCPKRSRCTLSKRFYDAAFAQDEYSQTLIDSRSGIMISQQEIDYLNSILTPLIKIQGQSIHHALLCNKNKILYSENTIYKLIDLGLLDIKNIDLPRKVRFRQRSKSVSVYKIDKHCLQNRTYEDFQRTLAENPDIPVVEMDTVEGIQGGKVLLTLHFVNASFMLAFIRDHNDAQSVIDIFNDLQKKLGLSKFKELFVLILTDNGSEFSNPSEIETDPVTLQKRTQIFYCHPSSPHEKGSCEVNHQLIRRILPKGTSFDDLTQKEIDLMMSHINSYKRKKLNNLSPNRLFSTLYGEDTLEKLNIREIDPQDINLTPNILKK